MKTDACVACGAEDSLVDDHATHLLSLPDEISVVKCRRCTLRWLHPVPLKDEASGMYRSMYFENMPEIYEKVASERVHHFRSRIRKIKERIGGEGLRVLDVGAATGEFVNEARIAGFEADGLEPSESACRRAEAELGIRMIRADLLDAALEESSYDVIHMNHVLEHIPNPNECLAKLHSVIRPGGSLLIEVPYPFGNAADRVFRWLGMDRPKPFSLYSVHHPFFYTPKSLGSLLKKHGFSIMAMSVWRYSLESRMIDARRYCRLPSLSLIEKYLHLFHTLFLEKGDFPFIEVYARRMRG